ncbi:fimbrial major subunit CsuA/B family protein [Pseudomonas syringae]|uniref:Fimbrial major subunit CsuA/B family protein n=1 Tax=Pseudomonas syringae TaxID=317 RepID=A0A9Q3X6F4_PSESX|nr:fimbrial major subunit CsuA/B family protein [Pseudomonas syringae]MCF5065685.1 fimbrial major subunit CsuA/B family protein [Pseudomonas syringae]MCF5075885.1 fimbrial major subunit CsuA/B family protein [Pseudomonas syringae]MCF5118722.1 fimbrial major subunit CsuA/B family protein [Pseudomonas syringae]MCF5381640.1 fimbrial major subunit CsuA/B family protein [Pseudomonas syringae]
MKGRAVLAVMGAMLCSTAYGAQLQVEVRIDVQRGCQLVGTTRSAGIEQLGVLDFGSGPRLDDPAGPLSAALISQRQPRLECNPDTPYQVRVDGGLHGGVGEVRYLSAAGAATKPIPYRIYADAARRIPLPVDVPLSGRVPDAGVVDLPLFGRIEPLKDIPAVGRYSDLLKVTVTW